MLWVSGEVGQSDWPRRTSPDGPIVPKENRNSMFQNELENMQTRCDDIARKVEDSKPTQVRLLELQAQLELLLSQLHGMMSDDTSCASPIFGMRPTRQDGSQELVAEDGGPGGAVMSTALQRPGMAEGIKLPEQLLRSCSPCAPESGPR